MHYAKLSPKQKAKVISEILKLEYPEVHTPLHHSNAYELLVAVLLSAQTLDSYVNKVTPALFKKYPGTKDLAAADIADIEKIIKGVNYYKTKAKHLVEMAKGIENEYDGKVPASMGELTKLPGVGRKTANVVINEWFYPLSMNGEGGRSEARPGEVDNKQRTTNNLRQEGGNLESNGVAPEGFVVDTHVKRVAKRLGLTTNDDPAKVEQDLMKLFPRDEWPDVSLRLIFHGRYRCKAKNPLCKNDPVWTTICSCATKSQKSKVKSRKLMMNNQPKDPTNLDGAIDEFLEGS